MSNKPFRATEIPNGPGPRAPPDPAVFLSGDNLQSVLVKQRINAVHTFFPQRVNAHFSSGHGRNWALRGLGPLRSGTSVPIIVYKNIIRLIWSKYLAINIKKKLFGTRILKIDLSKKKSWKTAILFYLILVTMTRKSLNLNKKWKEEKKKNKASPWRPERI